MSEAIKDLDQYGNPPDRVIYCCFPDCGCDGARLCMAETGPSFGAENLNLKKEYFDDH